MQITGLLSTSKMPFELSSFAGSISNRSAGLAILALVIIVLLVALRNMRGPPS